MTTFCISLGRMGLRGVAECHVLSWRAGKWRDRGWVTRVQHVLQAAILHGTLTLLIEDEPFGWRIGRRVPGLLSLIGYVDSNLSNGRQIRPLITVVPTDVIRRYRHAMLLLERAVFPIAIKAVRAHCKNRHLRGDVAASPLVGSSLLFV